MPPSISIVTVCLDDRSGLDRTLASVGGQTFTDREVIVVDGGSTDGSVDVIQAHRAVVTSWSSEKDGGVYDAQNKGARRATGTYCLFLNAGDAFVSHDSLAQLMAGGRGEDILYGDVVWEDHGRRRLQRMPEAMSLGFLMRTNLPHQCTAIRRSLFERLGPYDVSFRIAADYEFFLRAIVVHGATTRHAAVPVSAQVLGGLSSRPESFARLREERLRARERAIPAALLAEWEAQRAADRGALLHWFRRVLRPLARRVRGASRALRRKPDSAV